MKVIRYFTLLLFPIASLAQTTDATITSDISGTITGKPYSAVNMTNVLTHLNGGKMSRIEANSTTGTNTYATTISWVSSYTNGLWFPIVFQNGNTGASTINVNTLGAKSIVKSGSTTLTGGEITSGTVYILYYDGTNFQLSGGSGGGSSYTAGTGLTLTGTTFSVNTSQNIAKLSNLTTNGFVKTGSGDGTLSIDNSTYLTGNQSITLSGDISGTGTTAITTAIGSGKVTNTMLAGSIADSKLTLTALSGILKSNGSAVSAAVSGTDYAPATSGTSILKGNGSGGFSNASAGTDYQAVLTSGTNIKTVNGSSLLGSGDVGTINETHGGTNQTSWATGDLPYASATNTLSKLAIGTGNQVLTTDPTSGVPSWKNDNGVLLPDIGRIITENWNNTSNWTNVGTATFTASGGTLTLNGGSPASPNLGNYIYNSNFGESCFSNLEVGTTVTVGTINSTSWGVNFTFQGTAGKSVTSFIWHACLMLDATNKGKLRIYFNNSNSTFVESTGTLGLSAGDQIVFKVRPLNHTGGVIYAFNTTTKRGIEMPFYYVQIFNSTGNFVALNNYKFAIGTMGGTDHKFTAPYTVDVFHKKNTDWLFVGDSFFGGNTWAPSQNLIAAVRDKVFDNIETYGGSGLVVEGAVASNILMYGAKKILIQLGTNNQAAGDNAATVVSKLNTLISSLTSGGYVGLGTDIFITEIAPKSSADMSGYASTYASSFTSGSVVPIYSSMVETTGSTMAAALVSSDGLHPNYFGKDFYANTLISFLPFNKRPYPKYVGFEPLGITGQTSGNLVYNNGYFATTTDNINYNGTALVVNASEAASIRANMTTASTAVNVNPMNIRATSTGDMVDGFGPKINYQIQDNAGVANNIATIGARRSGADNTGTIFFRPITTGSEADAMTLSTTAMTLSDAVNVPVGTTSGTKIGTATSQKLGFFNATPIVQPGATTDLGTVLSNLGLRASGTAYPITTSGSVTLTGTTAIKGVTDGSSAAAGNIGENTSSLVSTYTNFTTTATYQQIATISLTAGSWDIYATVTCYDNSAVLTAASDAIFTIATATASATGATEGETIAYIAQGLFGTASHETVTFAPKRVEISGTTSYYLNGQMTFTSGNPQFVGKIRAVRVR